MMVYFAGWAVNLFCIVAQEITGYRRRFFLLFTLGVLAVIACLRGDVGTDTANYELMLADFAHGYAWDGREPGFVVLGWLLAVTSPTVEVAVRALSLVFFLLLLLFVYRSDQNERFLLLSYLLPAFAYHYSMNGLRIGLASVFLLLAVQRVRSGNVGLSWKVGLLALAFHYSSAFSILCIAVSQRPWFRLATALMMMFSLLVLLGGFLVMEFYMMNKAEQFQTMQAPGVLSGMGKIVPVFFILTGLSLGSLPLTEKLKLVCLGAGFVLFGWGLTQLTYAGLRVLDLIAFAAPLSILASYSRLGLKFDRSLRTALVIAGCVSASFIYRGFLLEYGEGPTPFLPYAMRRWDVF